MPSSESQFTATAGEHFVAYRVASFGLIPALVRQAVRSFDLLVSTPDGSRSTGIIIKTAVQARRGDGQTDVLEFPFSPRSVERMAPSSFFCFVDLQSGDATSAPDVYVMPMAVLKAEFAGVRSPKYLQPRFTRSVAAMEAFKNNWEPLIAAMSEQEASPVAEKVRAVAAVRTNLVHGVRFGENAAATRWTDPLAVAEVPDVCEERAPRAS